jgi:hypothetical protein
VRRASNFLVDGELALSVGLSLVDESNTRLRVQLIERDSGAGLRLAGSLVDYRTRDSGMG